MRAFLVALLLALLAAPATASAQGLAIAPVKSLDHGPKGYRLTPRQALDRAARLPLVRRELRKHPGLHPKVQVPQYFGDRRYEVVYSPRHGKPQVDVHVSAWTGKVLESWTGVQADTLLARGYEPHVGRALNHLYIWIPLALLFLAPFFDPRRPFRLLHFDLLALLGFGISQVFFNAGRIGVSVPLVYPFLAYLLVRMLMEGLGSRPRARGPLLPHARVSWLAVGLVALMIFRVGLHATGSQVMDVGSASVLGADHIVHHEDIYSVKSGADDHDDTYGPVTYVAYLPFLAIWPADGPGGFAPAAKAAALSFDLLVLIGLMLLGTRLRGGREGRVLGLALAYAWAAYPFSLYVLMTNTNDTLLAALLVFALLAMRSAPLRGLLLGLAGAAKFAPLALAPLFAAASRERGRREVAAFCLALAGTVAVAVFVYLPDGGLREFWDATLGYQLSRSSPFSLWGLHPSLHWLQSVVKVGALAVALAAAAALKRPDLRRLAALGAATLIAVQLTTTYWMYFYIVWFAPFALLALFSARSQPVQHVSGPSQAGPVSADSAHRAYD
jgi:hypothetical protein